MQDQIANQAAYSVDAFAHQIDVSRGTVYNLIKNGDVRSVKIGARTVIPATEINRLLENSE